MAIITDHMLGSIWQREGGLANAAMDLRLPWLPPADRARVERLRQARMLFDGRHYEYFVGEGRSGFSFTPLAEGGPILYCPFNLLGLTTKKTADLLFGEEPRIHHDDAELQRRIAAIVDRSWLGAQLLDAGKAASWAGCAFLEVVRLGDMAYVHHVAPEGLFPVGAIGPDRQYRRYVRYETAMVAVQGGSPGKEATETLLLETRYAAGSIERAVFRLAATDVAGPRKAEPLPLDRWPHRTGFGGGGDQPLTEVEQTGLSRPSIVYVPNEAGSASDYDGLISFQDLVNAKTTQIARVLAKHADPKLAAPATAADEKGNLPADHEVFFFRSKEDIPSYITWNAELAAAMEDRKFAVNALCMAAEMSQVLLGLKEGAAPDAARKLRLEATNTLAKVQRKAACWQPAIKLAIALALEAEIGRPLPAEQYPGVEMRDGLPDDELDRAQVVATLRGAGVMSRKRALQQQWLDAASVQEELAELAREDQAATPGVLLDETTTSSEEGR